MRKYAEIIDDTTKRCNVGIGTDDDFYKSLGMVELDVEQAWDGSWYIVGYAPQKPQQLIDQEEISELKSKLAASDYAVIKIAEGAATPEEYADLISQRQQWRARINELEASLSNE